MGFSLIELLLVISITLIISAISVPMFVNAVEGNQLKTAARNINRMHRYARAMSVLNGTPMLFAYNATNKTFMVTAQTNTAPLIQRALPEKVTLKSFALVDDSVEFNPPAVPYSTSGQCQDYTITLFDTRDKQITIEIDGIAGSVRFEDE